MEFYGSTPVLTQLVFGYSDDILDWVLLLFLSVFVCLLYLELEPTTLPVFSGVNFSSYMTLESSPGRSEASCQPRNTA